MVTIKNKMIASIILLSLSLISPLSLAVNKPYQLYLKYSKDSKDDVIRFSSFAILGSVNKNRPSARVVGVKSKQGNFSFHSASHSGQAKDMKINPEVALSFEFLTQNHIRTVVLYGRAHLNKQHSQAIKHSNHTWDQYTLKPTRYKFVIAQPHKYKRPDGSMAFEQIHLEDYQRINNRYVKVRDEYYPVSSDIHHLPI